MPSFQFVPAPVQSINFTTQQTSIAFSPQQATSISFAQQDTAPSTALGPVQGPKGEQGNPGPTGQTIVTVKARRVPTLAANGVRITFTLPDATIVAGSLTVTLNGLEEPLTEAGNTFTFTDAPYTGDMILCRYQVI